jgi:hypothetical protein
MFLSIQIVVKLNENSKKLLLLVTFLIIHLSEPEPQRDAAPALCSTGKNI